jgi:hypothetical protein
MSDATPPSSAAAASFTLIAPRRNIAGDFEWSVHSLPPLVRRHCAQLFPDRAPPDDRTLVIVTVQRTQHDIIQMGAEVDREKDVCLERFYAWGNDVMARLRADAAVAQASPPWADLIDPCSGVLLGPSRCNRSVFFPFSCNFICLLYTIFHITSRKQDIRRTVATARRSTLRSRACRRCSNTSRERSAAAASLCTRSGRYGILSIRIFFDS